MSQQTPALKIAVIGAHGRMGKNVVAAVRQAPDLQLVAELDQGDDVAAALAETGAQIGVDFTVPAATEANVMAMIAAGVHAVVGTTGWDDAALARVRDALGPQPRTGVLIAPNFALGAVLAVRFAEQAARWFESVEVIELHHPDKVDTPSGTALHTAQRIAAARREAGLGPSPDATASGDLASRGADVDGVRVHSVRLRGLVAHEEILLGGVGEQLTIRTDSFDRSSFMPGVLAAARRISDHPGLTVGLDKLLEF